MLLERVLRGRGVRGVTSAAAGKIFGDVIVWRVHARGTMWDTSTSVLVTIMGVNVCVRQLQEFVGKFASCWAILVAHLLREL